MIYYSYNEITKEYNGPIDPNINPLETQNQGYVVYLQPALTTNIKPPNTIENEVAVFENEKWIIKEDYRGKDVYNTTTIEKYTIEEIGKIPTGFTEFPPLYPHPLWNEINKKWEIDLVKQEESLIEDKIQAEMREIAIKSLKESGDLPVDYKE